MLVKEEEKHLLFQSKLADELQRVLSVYSRV